MGKGARSLTSRHGTGGIDQLEPPSLKIFDPEEAINQIERPSLQVYNPEAAGVCQPQLVKHSFKPTENQIKIEQARTDFMQRLQETYSLRPLGELSELVSRGFFPTARQRFYSEIIIGPVTDWLDMDEVRDKVLNGEYLQIPDFERYYQGRPSHKSQDDLWQKLVKEHLPEDGRWR